MLHLGQLLLATTLISATIVAVGLGNAVLDIVMPIAAFAAIGVAIYAGRRNPAGR